MNFCFYSCFYFYFTSFGCVSCLQGLDEHERPTVGFLRGAFQVCMPCTIRVPVPVQVSVPVHMPVRHAPSGRHAAAHDPPTALTLHAARHHRTASLPRARPTSHVTPAPPPSHWQPPPRPTCAAARSCRRTTSACTRASGACSWVRLEGPFSPVEARLAPTHCSSTACPVLLLHAPFFYCMPRV